MNRRTDWTPIQWAEFACDTLMAQYVPEELPPAYRWHYHQGVFLCGMEEVLEHSGDERYEQYIKRYVDKLIDAEGNFYFARDELDAIQPGLLLFRLAEKYKGDQRYSIAARKLRHLFDTLNQTSEGGYWHKDKYPYNMWLDGLYMGGVFALKYANRYNDPELRDFVFLQERLMRRHMRDEQTGLLYHAWDESKKMPWANQETGCSPEFWARSLGWYGLALSQFLDELPESDPRIKQWEQALQQFVQAILPYQDAKTGLWYQVVDKGEREDNWLETSGSCLFVYAIAKAYQRGLVEDEALAVAKKGYLGLLDAVIDEQDQFVLPHICIGTSAGDYENYVTRPTSENDLHGVGAFVLASVELEKILASVPSK